MAPLEEGLAPGAVLRWAALGVGVALLLGGLGAYDLWSPDEPRYAEVAREMRERGDFLVPHVNAEPYYEKPPLLFWLIALAAAPWGGVTETAARLPLAVSALITLGFTYALARGLFGRRVAFWAAVILLTNWRFWWQARFAQIDMLLTACMAAGLYAVWRWDKDRETRWLVLLYGATGLGMLAKGPPALVFPLVTLWVLYWRDHASRKATHWVLGALGAVAMLGVWFVPARLLAVDQVPGAAQTQIAHDLFRNIIGRIFLGVSKAQPPWYYFVNIPVDFLPWSLLLPWTIPWVWRHRHDGHPMRLLLSFTVPVFILFSMAIGKRAIYLLPLWPALAMLMAASVPALVDGAHTAWRRRTAYVWALGLAGIGAAPFLMLFTVFADRVDAGVLSFGVAGLLAAVAVLVAGLATGARALPWMIGGGFALLGLLAPHTLLPVINEFKSAKAFCAPVRRLAEADAEFRLYSAGFSREPYIFYSKRAHQERFNDPIGVDPAAITPGRREALRDFQWAVRDRLTDAVADVPVAHYGAPGVAAHAALQTAAEAAIATREADDRAAVPAFEAELAQAVDAYLAEFSGDGPAFMFVKVEDWRWMLALAAQPPALHVTRHEQVGSREVLLVANTTGRALLKQHAIAVTEPDPPPVPVEDAGDVFGVDTP
ncbi:MAG: ArnT family glycosyltransferase [Candidatus Hydrogenedentota bacterium]